MGCRVTKNENISSPASTMPRTSDKKTDFKAKFEKKMCIAKETPEPEFDLQECNLKDIPSSVFVLCKVLRKEKLLLSGNQLTELSSGGLLQDLSLLQLLDLRSNKFKKLPDDIYKLDNLRICLLGDNKIERLPHTINRLKNLEHLDLSNNRLATIEQIAVMPNLRILNLMGNPQLIDLPFGLSTCDSLVDLIISPEYIQNIPTDLADSTTLNILRFLSQGHAEIKQNNEFMSETDNTADVPNKNNQHSVMDEQNSVFLCENNFHKEQQRKKDDLLRVLLADQIENDIKVNQVHEERQLERNKLIENIRQSEENSTFVIDKLLSLKTTPDPYILEQENEQMNLILETLHIQQSDLRKQEILAAMNNLINYEVNHIHMYQQEKYKSTKDFLERESQHETDIIEVIRSNDRMRLENIERILHNEELQKAAVGAFIQRNDARSWALVEQLRIVETELSALTQYEIERKNFNANESLTNLYEKRMELTNILVDLLNQQEARKRQLTETLISMEHRNVNQESYWLMQYQKLLDQQPVDGSFYPTQIDPRLGYNLLVQGAIHCLPFLSKIWQYNHTKLEFVTGDDLLSAGIRSETDRAKILQSINDFIKNRQSCAIDEVANEIVPQAEEAATITPEQPGIAADSTTITAECVICMDEKCNMIFIPCGHICSCEKCQQDLRECPMCRTKIDKRIKIIQSS